jgi:P22 coat protein - gene protein 5
MGVSMTVNVLGTASTGYLQNLVFHENAFALVVTPMEKPAGAVDVARKSYKGLSVRVIPYYDGVNDISNYRLDILFGVRTLVGRLATRLSGSP